MDLIVMCTNAKLHGIVKQSLKCFDICTFACPSSAGFWKDKPLMTLVRDLDGER